MLDSLFHSFKLALIGFLILPVGFLILITFFSDKKKDTSLYSSDKSLVSTPLFDTFIFKLWNRKKRQKARFWGFCFGYLYASNSGLNNSFAYKYIWDKVYEMDLSSYEINAFYKFFNKGKQRNFTELGECFDKYRNLWNESNENISIFTTMIQLLFIDNIFSENERNIFYNFAKLFDINKSQSDRILQSFINKYKFEKCANSEDYKSSFKFGDFDESDTYGSSYNNYQQQGSSQYDSYSEENYFSKRSREQKEQRESYNEHSSRTQTPPTADKYETALLLLNITRDTTEKEAKKAYRKLMHTYHPDRAVGNKLPPEEVKRYTELCQQIQAAWETIKNYKHW